MSACNCDWSNGPCEHYRQSIAAAPDALVPLPPCPICGKDDLFMGTDGRPGCPHCEVAVTLPLAARGAAALRDDCAELGAAYAELQERFIRFGGEVGAIREALPKLIRQYHGIAHSHLGRAARGGSWLYCDDRWCADMREVLSGDAEREAAAPDAPAPRTRWTFTEGATMETSGDAEHVRVAPAPRPTRLYREEGDDAPVLDEEPILAAPASQALDVERLARALLWTDDDDPGVLNDIAIDDEAATVAAQRIAERYARLPSETGDET